MSSSEVNPFAARGAQPGDMCILLMSASGVNGFYQVQQQLQSFFGGRITSELHLTCQRFEIPDEQLPALIERLRRIAAMLRPFPLIGISVLQLYSPYRQVHILKLGIEISVPLQRFNARLAETMQAMGLRSLYRLGAQSSLVTVLEDIRDNTDQKLLPVSLPIHLFDASQIVVSRIHGPFAFETVERIPIG